MTGLTEIGMLKLQMTESEIEEGVKRCLDNAKSLLKDAKLLLEIDSTGHALFFVVSAIEETSKAFIYAGARIGVWKHGETNRDVTHHFSKLSLFISHLFTTALEDVFERRRKQFLHQKEPVKPLDIDDFVEMVQDIDTAQKELWKSRIQALYVDRKNGKWTSPSEFKTSVVKTLLKRAERYVHDTEFQTRNILKAEKELAVKYRNWLQEEFVPFAINYFLENIEELYAEKAISQKLYEKLKKLKAK